MRPFRWVMAVLLIVAALFVWAGPVFGLLVVATGGDLYVRGGAVRVLMDLSIGTIALWLSIRTIRASALRT